MPPPTKGSQHLAHARPARDGVALAQDGAHAGGLHAREVHPAAVVPAPRRVAHRLGERVRKPRARRQRDVDEREEGGPVVGREHTAHVRAHRLAQPRRRVAVERVELGGAHLCEAREEAVVEGEEAERHGAALPVPCEPLVGADRAVGFGQLWVVAARPEHAAVKSLEQQRPRERAPPQAVRQREQRQQRTKRRDGRFRA
mmetsp:Transcript_15054/g.34533  ORF Transcript_15054/g.34533 Transcript_15054/m.34533 type:complete len:200 (-) Transcript_15054:1949-2548(-)